MGRLDKGTRVQKRTPIVLAFFLLLVAGLFCFGSLGLIDLSNRHLFSRFSIIGILELLATVSRTVTWTPHLNVALWYVRGQTQHSGVASSTLAGISRRYGTRDRAGFTPWMDQPPASRPQN
jgi:hypothetical protein